ncbi:MAG TPA: IS1595 family transposase [Candidatus Paceibacterota bacterium]
MKYTIKDFARDFGTDDQCLEYVFKKRFKVRGFYRIKNRLAYGNSKGKQIYPLKGTIFERSSTPLSLWFYAIYLFSQSRHGVSAMELQRQLGVTYKCAFRIGHKIRSLMKEKEPAKFTGIVECDEAYVGGKRRLAVRGRSSKNKTPVFGIVQRGGKVHAEAMDNIQSETLIRILKKRVNKGSKIITDGFSAYKPLKWEGFKHKSVNHSKWEYVRQEGKLSINTNTIEGFWGQLKRQFNGTHYFVSRQHLSKYLDEVVFRYNHQGEQLFSSILEKV